MKHIKFFYIVYLILMVSCTKTEIEPIPDPPKDIFEVKETTISNEQDLNFNLNNGGIFVLKLIDASTNQVISKEKIIGVPGKNINRIYTKSITTQYLYLVLEDETKTEIKRTKLKIN